MVVLSDIIVWRHRSVSLNNEKNCCEISEDKIAFCEKTAGLRRGKFSDSNSACLKVLVPVKIFQFQDMLNESERYQDAANGLYVGRELHLYETIKFAYRYRFHFVSTRQELYLSQQLSKEPLTIKVKSQIRNVIDLFRIQ